MFLVHAPLEEALSVVFHGGEPDLQRYRIAEQCLNLPLWRLEVLPHARPEEPSPLWRTLLAGTTDDALDMLLCGEWKHAKVSVVLPAYMTDKPLASYAVCKAIWACSDRQGKVARLLETDQGSFIDVPSEVDPASTRKTKPLWTSVPH
jgi:hypothetical protein